MTADVMSGAYVLTTDSPKAEILTLIVTTPPCSSNTSGKQAHLLVHVISYL